MKASYIDYRATQSFSSGLIRYLEQDPSLKDFYGQSPSIDGFRKLLEEKKVAANRQVLVEVLQEQYIRLNSPITDKVKENIDLLQQENTFTITTGHQLNIFTGPLYFIYKIATAIKLSQQLKTQFPDKNFVPVYWMATEDHDFEEINHTYVGGKKIVWDKACKGATGRLNTEYIAEALHQYQGILGASPNALQLAGLVKAAYEQYTNLADATRHLVNQIFEIYGLIILDADHPQLKRQFAKIIEADILEQRSYQLITETSLQLKKSEIEIEVNPREINFFYLNDELRERIVFQDGFYRVLNTNLQFSSDELRKHIQEHPEKFSPNVCMRPLYQESILPNLAYVGGGAEMLYWLELKSTFTHYKLDFPILILRNSAQIISEEQEHKIKRLGLDYRDVFQSLDQLKKAWLLQNSNYTLNLDQETGAFKEIFEQLKDRAKAIDQTLVPSTEAVEARLYKAIDRLEKKLLKAEKRNHEEAMVQLEKLHTDFFPRHGLQERSENFGLYFSSFGSVFIEQLIASFQPLDFKFTLITLSK